MSLGTFVVGAPRSPPRRVTMHAHAGFVADTVTCSSGFATASLERLREDEYSLAIDVDHSRSPTGRHWIEIHVSGSAADGRMLSCSVLRCFVEVVHHVEAVPAVLFLRSAVTEGTDPEVGTIVLRSRTGTSFRVLRHEVKAVIPHSVTESAHTIPIELARDVPDDVDATSYAYSLLQRSPLPLRSARWSVVFCVTDDASDEEHFVTADLYHFATKGGDER